MDRTYINIGNEKCCCFVHISRHWIRQLKRYPVLDLAVEEALKCAEVGFYAAGILVFAQLLQLMKEPTPKARHDVAHEILAKRPTQGQFDDCAARFKAAAAKRNQDERRRANSADAYETQVVSEWLALIGGKQPLGREATK